MTLKSATPSYEDIWRKYDSVEQHLSAQLSERMLELGKLRPGMHVLDLATGRGEPAIPAAMRVSPGGDVVGVDIDSSMLQIAREKANLEGASNLEFIVSDIETLDGVPSRFFDVAFARWGLMYLQRPVQALRVVRRLLAPNGMLVAAVWTDPDQASFFKLPRTALSNIVSRQLACNDGPGTFYYSDLDRLTRDLQAAGFDVKYTEILEVDVIEVKSDDELIAWARVFGMSELLQELSGSEQSAWERELISNAEPHRTEEGNIRLGGLTRLVVAA
jgi:ubiquinone/menaquinone biosynthesis C-methylase UbiE